MKPFFTSIRAKVQLWYGTFLLLALTALCLIAYLFVWSHQVHRIDSELEQSERQLLRSIVRTLHEREPKGTPSLPPHELLQRLKPDGVTVPEEIARLFGGNEEGSHFYVLYDREGRRLLASTPVREEWTPEPAPKEGFVTVFRRHGSERLYFRSSVHGTRLVIGRDITPELKRIRQFGFSLGTVSLLVWSFGLIGGWGIAGKAIRPIQNISDTASRIASGNLNERIPLNHPGNELDQLGHVLNQTFDRLHDALERQRQFTADASHELRTPLSILLSETQRALKRERTLAEYQETLQTCRLSAQRMHRLVEMLLMFARQEHTPLAHSERQPCDLALLLQETAENLRPLASATSTQIKTDDIRKTSYRGDPTALQIVMSNLLHNAIAHAGDNAIVKLTAFSEGDHVGFSISDNGKGIAPVDLPYIFDRFYRVDKARSGSDGHSGLGLAIARMIIENHGGTITVDSHLGKGATFQVRLPQTQ